MWIRQQHLALALMWCALAPTVSAQTQPKEPVSRRAAVSAQDSSAILRNLDQALDDVAERVLPTVVQISVSGFGPSRRHSDSESVIERQRGIGSGVIVDPDGYIITNAHVITGAQRIQVVMQSVTSELVPYQTSLLRRQRAFTARLIGVHRFTDLALLKIDAAELPYIPLQEAYQARLGQTVLAIGSPQGLDHTLTKGIVSALGRQQEIDHPMIYVQTDAPINPGNSGGALVDRDGNLVGINTFIYTQSGGSEGLGFAIPEPTVRFVYEELRRYGHVRQSVIGAKAQTITATLAAGLALPQDWGVIISDVVPDGPAQKAGLKAKDIVVAVDDRAIDSLPKFAASLFLHPHDAAVRMEVLRGSEPVKLLIPAIEAQPGVENLADLIDSQSSLVAPLGIFALDLDRSKMTALSNIRSFSGVVVAGKVDYTPAIDADLAVGDVIVSINGARLSAADQFRSQLERVRPGDPIVLEIERQGTYQFVSFEME